MPYIGKQLSNGNYLKLDDISSSFNGSTTTFSLTNGGSAYYPGSEFSILVSVGGVIQEPESAYQISNDEITFANAPTAQDSFFCVVLGDAIGINVPGNNTVNGAQMAKPFNYDGGLLYLDDTNNKVGINSTSPSVALDVVGDLKVTGNITGIGGTLGGTLIGNVYSSSGISTFNDLRVTNNLTVEGTTTTLDTNLIGVDRVEVGANSNTVVGVAITQSGTADILQLFDGTSKVVTVDDEGKVGIGITNPSNALDVQAGTTNTAIVARSTDAKAQISLLDNSTTSVGSVVIGAEGDELFLTSGSGGAERFRIAADSNITQTIDTDGDGFIITTGTANIKPMLTGNSNRSAANNTIFGISGKWNNTEVGRIAFEAGADTTNKDDGHINFYTRVSGGSLTSRLRIDSSGRLMVGQNSAYAASGTGNMMLTVTKDATNRTDAAISNQSSGDNASAAVVLATHGQDYILEATGSGNTTDGVRAFRILKGTSERLRIASDGKVAIGGNYANTSSFGRQVLIDGALALNNDSGTVGVGFHRGHANTYGYIGTGNFAVDGGANDDFGISSGPTGDILFGTGSGAPERMRIDSSGNLGVGNFTSVTNNWAIQALRTSGTTTIASKNTGGNASVYIEASDGNTAKLELAEAGTGSYSLQVGNDNALMFFDDSSERLRITSGGNLTLGTSVSNERVHIHTASSLKAQQQFTNTTTGTGAGDGLVIGITGGEDSIFWNQENTNVLFATNNTERVKIYPTGKVTINPYNTFHDPTHQPTLTLSNESESNLYEGGKWSHAAIGINNSTHTASGGSKSQIVFGYLPRSGGYDFTYGSGYIGATSVSQSGAGKVDLVFGTKDVTTDTQPTERLRITSSGQVLIGIDNAVSSDVNFQLHSASSGTGPILNMTNDTGDCRIFFGQDSSGSSANAQGQLRYNVASNYLALYTAATERLRIDSSGRFLIAKGTADTTTSQIQIGDPSTGYTWDVGDVPQVLIAGVNNESPTSGTLNIALRVADENNNNMFQIHNRGGGNTDVGQVYVAGNLGLGVNNPADKLHLYNSSNDPFIKIQRDTASNVSCGGIKFSSSGGIFATMGSRATSNSGAKGAVYFQTQDGSNTREALRVVGASGGHGSRLTSQGNSVCVFGSDQTMGGQFKDGAPNYNSVYSYEDTAYQQDNNGAYGGYFTVQGDNDKWYPVTFTLPQKFPQVLTVGKYVHNYATWDGKVMFRAEISGTGYGAHNSHHRVNFHSWSTRQFVGRIKFTTHNNAYMVLWLLGGGRGYHWGTIGGGTVSVGIYDDGGTHNLGPGNTSETYISSADTIDTGYEPNMNDSPSHTQTGFT